MSFFLDTDICIFALKGRFAAIEGHLRSSSPEQIKIPSIVKAELLLGARKSDNPQKVSAVIEAFLSPFESIPFCHRCAVLYAQIRYELETKGEKIGPNDLIIAATAVVHHSTLITHNTREYQRIAQLKLQDWTQE